MPYSFYTHTDFFSLNELSPSLQTKLIWYSYSFPLEVLSARVITILLLRAWGITRITLYLLKYLLFTVIYQINTKARIRVCHLFRPFWKKFRKLS